MSSLVVSFSEEEMVKVILYRCPGRASVDTENL